MREILEGIYIWSRLAEPQGYDFNGYFVLHAEGNLVIDPVEPESADLDFIGRHGAAHVLITNRNHSRAANAVREATGARTAIHFADAAHAQEQGCIIDEALSVGDRFGPLTAYGAPGKSPGEVAFYWPERRVLFTGDVVIGNPPGQLSLLPDEKMDDPVGLRETVRKLPDIGAEAILVGDGAPILDGAESALSALIATLDG